MSRLTALGYRLDACRRSDQDRHDQPRDCRVHGRQQRCGIDRIHDRGRHRCAAGGAGENGAHAIVAADTHIGQRNPRAADLHGRRARIGGAGDHRLAALVGADAIERDIAFRRLLLAHRQRRRHGVADAHGMEEAQFLAEIDRPGPGQPGAEHRGDQAGAPHAVDDDVVEHIRFGIGRIDMCGVHVAGRGREQVDVALRDGVRQAGRLADDHFVEGAVLDKEVHGSVLHRAYLSRT